MDEPAPWRGYNSAKLHSDWTYPTRRDELALALHGAGAKIAHADRYVPGGYDPTFGTSAPGASHKQTRSQPFSISILLRARFSAASHPLHDPYRYDNNTAHLAAYAVHRKDLLTARTHIQTWLPRTAEWLAAGARRGNAWLASEHEYTVFFSGVEAWAVES